MMNWEVIGQAIENAKIKVVGVGWCWWKCCHSYDQP